MDNIKIIKTNRNRRVLKEALDNNKVESLLCRPEIKTPSKEVLHPNDIYRNIRLQEKSIPKAIKKQFVRNNTVELTGRQGLGPLAFEMIAYNKIASTINLSNRRNSLDLINLNNPYTGLALWDFDGTLGDTEHNQWLSYNQVLERYGIVIEKDFYAKKCRGNSSKAIYDKIMEEYGIEFDPSEINQEREDVISQMEKNNTIQPYEEMIERVKYTNSNNNFILTNNLKENVETILKGWGVTHLFKDIISATQLGKHKKEILSNPKHYFGSHREPYEMVVIEDSLETIRSANTLGIPTIGVFGGMSIDEEIKTLSTVCISV